MSQKYHIAIDNLCTFLPQDRVGSFSGFDSKMLLEETEKCVVVNTGNDGDNDNHREGVENDDEEEDRNTTTDTSTSTSTSTSTHRLYDTHMKLIELEKEILESDTNLQTIQDKAQKLQSEVDQLEKMKELMEERQRYLEKLKKFEQKLAWVLFELKREEAVKLKDQKKEIKNLLNKARQKVRPIEIKMEEITVDLSRNDERKKELKRVMKNAMNGYDGSLSKNEKYRDEIDTCVVALTEMDSVRRRAEHRVNECRLKVEQTEAVLKDFPPEQEMVDAYKAAHDEQKIIRDNLRAVKHNLSQMQQ